MIAVVNAHCRRQSVLQVSNLDCVVKIWCQLRFLDHMVNKRKEHLNFVVSRVGWSELDPRLARSRCTLAVHGFRSS